MKIDGFILQIPHRNEKKKINFARNIISEDAVFNTNCTYTKRRNNYVKRYRGPNIVIEPTAEYSLHNQEGVAAPYLFQDMNIDLS